MVYGSTEWQHCDDAGKIESIQSRRHCECQHHAKSRLADALYLAHRERHDATSQLCVYARYCDEKVPSLEHVLQRLAHQDGWQPGPPRAVWRECPRQRMEYSRGQSVIRQSRTSQRHGDVADVEPVPQSSRLHRRTRLHQKYQRAVLHFGASINFAQVAAQHDGAIQLLADAKRDDRVGEFAWLVFKLQTRGACDQWSAL